MSDVIGIRERVDGEASETAENVLNEFVLFEEESLNQINFPSSSMGGKIANSL
jgi:hypothetical protein